MNRINSAAASLGMIITCAAVCSASIHVEFDLTANTLTTAEATFDVAMSFTGDPADQIESFQLSVIGSDPLLTNNDTDYGRFNFALNTAVAPLNTWSSTGSLPLFGLELGFAADPFFGPFITPSATPLSLGTLSVDLTGLSANTNLFVTLSGGGPGFNGTDVGGTFGGGSVFSVAAAGDPNLAIAYADPGGVAFQTSPTGGGEVPEPAGLAVWSILTLVGGAGLVYHRLRNVNGR